MSNLEKFVMQEIHRKDLKKCPWNPRKITAEAKRRLKAGIERHGLVQPLIYNKRSGLLVGGHQRLSCLDDIHESKDYTLNVAVIDVDAAKEKELVVFLNNTSSMGYWNDDDLLHIIQDTEVDTSALGFSAEETDYFDRLMKQNESVAMEYMKEIENSYDTLQESALENAEEIEQDKKNKKEQWEGEVSKYFEEAEPFKPLEQLTDKEKLIREDYHKRKHIYAKQDTNDGEIVIRILFTSRDNARQWLQKIGVPPENTVIHEKELAI